MNAMHSSELWSIARSGLRSPLGLILQGAMLSIICLCAAAESVGTPPMAPGLWSVVTRPDMQGPLPPLPRTNRLCISPEDVAAGRVAVPSMPACKVRGGLWTGTQLALELSCPGLPEQARVSGELQVSGTLFTGRVTVISQPDQEGAARGEFTYQQMGRWLASDCTAAPSLPAPAALPMR